MRTTIDIPEPLYRELKDEGRERGSFRLILCSVEARLGESKRKRGKRIVPPIIKSERPGTLYLDNAKIAELVPFP